MSVTSINLQRYKYKYNILYSKKRISSLSTEDMLPDRSTKYRSSFQISTSQPVQIYKGTRYKYIILYSKLLTLSYNHYHWHHKQTHHDDHTVHCFSFNSCPIGTVFNRFSEPTSSSNMTWRSFSYRQQLHFSNHNIDVPSCRNCCHTHGIAKLHLKVTTNIGTSPCQSDAPANAKFYIYDMHNIIIMYNIFTWPSLW